MPSSQATTSAERLRQIAEKLLDSESPNTESAAELLKAASELKLNLATIHKLNAERQKLQQDIRSSHQWRTMFIAVSPLVTTVILAATLGFQIWQANKQAEASRVADAEKREALARQEQLAEATRFTEALKTIQESEKISPAAVLLDTFTKEPQKSEARKMVLRLLLNSKSEEDFEALFSGSVEPVTSSDLTTLLQLDRALYSQYVLINLSVDPSTNQIVESSVPDAQKSQYHLLRQEINYVSGRIGSLLRGPRDPGSQIDLTNSSLSTIDLTNANLRGANISGAVFSAVNFEGADLSEIAQFQNAEFFYSPWWRASRISKTFLSYLEEKYPFLPGGASSYAGSVKATSEEYRSNLERLHRIADTAG